MKVIQTRIHSDTTNGDYIVTISPVTESRFVAYVTHKRHRGDYLYFDSFANAFEWAHYYATNGFSGTL